MTKKKTISKPSNQDKSKTLKKKMPYEAPAWEVEDAEAEAKMACAKADAGCIPGPVQS